VSTGSADESPEQRLARWTDVDAAIGIAAEAEQLRARLDEKASEIDDLKARLAQLTSRVAQVEAANAELRQNAGRLPLTHLARRVYRRGRSAAAKRLPR
jgi:methyl-accepting chemotaxis protein